MLSCRNNKQNSKNVVDTTFKTPRTTIHSYNCTNTLFPFGNLNNQNFLLTFIGGNNTISNETKKLNRSLLLKPPTDLALLFNQFNNAIPENCSNPENVIQSKYYDIDELQQLKFLVH